LNEYFPQCDHGNIIITSRNPGLVVYASSHSVVSDMEEIDAVDLLLRSAGKEATDDTKTAAVHIVKVLHYLPLAIIQAGAFISKSGDIDSYLALYEQNRAQLLSQKPAQSHDNYAWTIYTTWQISFDQLSQPAATFLQLCSLLHHQGISEQIFKNAATYKFGPTRMAVAGISERELQLASLWIQPHIDFLLQDNSNVIPDFRHEFGKIYVWGEKLKKVENIQAAVVQKRRDLLGDDHQDTLEAIFWLAWIYRGLGKFREAEQLEVVVLQQQRNMLGDNHPDTLDVMGNLALTYYRGGKLKEAEQLGVLVLEKQRNVLLKEAEELQVVVLERRRNLLGDNHPDTLQAMENLAVTYKKLGKLKEAKELGIVALEKGGMSWAMGNLALTYKALGKLKEAEDLEVVVPEKRRNILDDNHPSTLLAMGNLAVTYRELGKLKEAKGLEVVVLEKRRNLLGDNHPSDNHPSTLRTMGNLAVTYSKLERWQEAEELGVAALKKQMDLLGDKHKWTLETMQNLAVTYEQLGKSKEADDLNVILRGSQA
ncbi:hypothetical protein C8R44DRAFT_946522, partial [Mycena epipterygia]